MHHQLRLLLYPTAWEDVKRGLPKPPLRGQEEGKSFWGSLFTQAPKHTQLMALEPRAEKPWGAAWRRRGADLGSPPSTVQMGVKSRLV